MRFAAAQIAAVFFVCLCPSFAQQLDKPITAVPRLVRVRGTLRPANGLPVGQVESATLSIYREKQGGTPLWQETQNVNLDANGQYTAMLGMTQQDGVPVELFSSGEPRWLGVQFNRPGEVEQPRVQLVSVPYALKASDAETLGGLPASAYLRVQPGEQGPESVPNSSTTAVTSSALPDLKSVKPKAITGTATANSVVKFTDSAGDIGNSIITDNGYLAVAGQAAMGSGHATQTFGFDLYVNGSNPTAVIDAYANPGTASLLLQGRSSSPSNQMLSVNSTGLFSITPSTTGSPAFSINQSGNLMAGTVSPWVGAKMQIRPGTNQDLAIGGPFSLPSGVTFHSFNDAITANEGFEFRGSPMVFSVGNVGIGTTTPRSTLDVAGNINFSGALNYQGNPVLGVPGGASSYNTAVGLSALSTNSAGLYNTATGYDALFANTNGQDNTATGYEALYSNTIAGSNTATGYEALYKNISGAANTAVGALALQLNTSADFNTAIGANALQLNTSGGNNTATGQGALYANTMGGTTLPLATARSPITPPEETTSRLDIRPDRTLPRVATTST
jgi:trimeric autotransporter adhesin